MESNSGSAIEFLNSVRPPFASRSSIRRTNQRAANLHPSTTVTASIRLSRWPSLLPRPSVEKTIVNLDRLVEVRESAVV
jgi:hypothetical protein